jgi:carboxyl-terminal processing protease
MSKRRLPTTILALAALLSGCGGGGGSGGASAGGAVTPPSSGNGCSLTERQNWAFSVLREHYLFPETLPAAQDPAGFADLNSYIDALTATARSQRRDRFFTFATSIASDDAFFASGATAGLGIRLNNDTATRRTFVVEAFEGAPALAAGIDRGTEIVAIGTSASNLRLVSEIIAAEGAAGVSSALGPTTAGTTRVLRIADAQGTREVSVTKASFDISPVSARYGSRIIEADGTRIGYLNLRTFVTTADAQLRTAFDQFRAAGITQFIIDFRYNGGGLISTAEVMGDLLGGNRATSEVFDFTTFRPEKASSNRTKRFSPRSQSVSPVKIAFIATGSTASASELVINGFLPYFGNGIALVGGNTFGKPVGQIGIDRAACDDRLRVVAFSDQNGRSEGFFYDGLADKVPVTCQAGDDFTKPLGDPQEASVARALDFLAGRACTPIPQGQRSQSARDGASALLTPANPTTAQREVPGLF